MRAPREVPRQSCAPLFLSFVYSTLPIASSCTHLPVGPALPGRIGRAMLGEDDGATVRMCRQVGSAGHDSDWCRGDLQSTGLSCNAQVRAQHKGLSS